MKWILNDTFLVILTSLNEVIVFDVLLQVFRIQPKFSDSLENNFSIKVQTKAHSNISSVEKKFKIFGYKNQVNF